MLSSFGEQFLEKNVFDRVVVVSVPILLYKLTLNRTHADNYCQISF